MITFTEMLHVWYGKKIKFPQNFFYTCAQALTALLLGEILKVTKDKKWRLLSLKYPNILCFKATWWNYPPPPPIMWKFKNGYTRHQKFCTITANSDSAIKVTYEYFQNYTTENIHNRINYGVNCRKNANWFVYRQTLETGVIQTTAVKQNTVKRESQIWFPSIKHRDFPWGPKVLGLATAVGEGSLIPGWGA